MQFTWKVTPRPEKRQTGGPDLPLTPEQSVGWRSAYESDVHHRPGVKSGGGEKNKGKSPKKRKRVVNSGQWEGF